MRLLFDHHLSHRLCRLLQKEFPSSAHVKDLGLERAEDSAIWEYAKECGYVIVSKDEDFQQQSFVYGPPPKVVWLRVGNCSTEEIAGVLREHAQDLIAFDSDPEAAFLVLP